VVDQGLGVFTGIVLTILLARYYGPETLGRYTVAITLASIISVIANLGVQTTIKRSIARKSRIASFYFRQSIIIRVSLSLPLSLLFCMTFVAILGYDDKSALFLFSATLYVFATGIFLLISGVLTSIHRSDKTLYINLLNKFIFLLVIYGGLITAMGIEQLIQLVMFVSLLIATIAVWYTSRAVRSVSCGNMPFTRIFYLKRLIIISLPLTLIAITEYLNLKIDNLLLSILDSESSVGFYAAAFQILMAFILLPLALIKVLFPNLVEVINKNSVSAITRILWIYTIGFLIYSFIVIIFIIFLGDFIIVLLYKEKFLASVGFLNYLIIGLPVIILNRLFNYVLVAMRKNNELLIITLAGVLVNIILNILLIPKYSIIGCIVATVVSETCVLVCGLLLYRRQLNQIAKRN
jgi:O-antigen/teichoic acid export membrane protein